MATRRPEKHLHFVNLQAWLDWLSQHHAVSDPIWVRISKRGGPPSLTYVEAVEGALIWGWIDSQKAALDDTRWLQRFSRRTTKSPWSKINRQKAEALIAQNRLEAPGLRAVSEAQADGRWASAYPGARSAEVPEDLLRALSKVPKAKRFFDSLDSANRFAILVRLHQLKTARGREGAIERYVGMCLREETLHPTRRKAEPKQKVPTPKTKQKSTARARATKR